MSFFHYKQKSGSLFPTGRSQSGFTLVEMMVSIALLLLLMLVLFTATDMAAKMNKRVSADVVSFLDASTAFTAMTHNLSTATLNTSYDYFPSQTGKNPPMAKGYIRQSALHFVITRTGGNSNSSLAGASAENNPTFGVFFQAPLGYTLSRGNTPDYSNLNNILNSCGYYIQFSDDQAYLPSSIFSLLSSGNNSNQLRYRFRLMQFLEPSEDMSVYGTSLNYDTPTNFPYFGAPGNPFAWYTTPIGAVSPQTMTWSKPALTLLRPVADNIIALILVPKVTAVDENNNNSTEDQTISKDYTYDSRNGSTGGNPIPQSSNGQVTQDIQQNQLPSVMRVTMVAIDEASAKLLQAKYGANPPQNPPLVDPTLFTNYNYKDEPDTYEKDLATLTTNLSNFSPKINFHIFTADVAIHEARWNTQGAH